MWGAMTDEANKKDNTKTGFGCVLVIAAVFAVFVVWFISR